jgi:hypothetical protein
VIERSEVIYGKDNLKETIIIFGDQDSPTPQVGIISEEKYKKLYEFKCIRSIWAHNSVDKRIFKLPIGLLFSL